MQEAPILKNYLTTRDSLASLIKIEIPKSKNSFDSLGYILQRAFTDSLDFKEYLEYRGLHRYIELIDSSSGLNLHTSEEVKYLEILDNFHYYKNSIFNPNAKDLKLDSIPLGSLLYTHPGGMGPNNVQYNMSNYFDAVLYFFNYLFDFATIIISIAILKQIVNSKPIRITTLIILDVVLAFILALFVFPVYVFFTSGLSPSEFWSYSFPFPISPIGTPDWAYILFSSTTLIPTIIILSTIFFLLIAKYVLLASKATASYFLERAAEDEPEKLQIGTLTGTLFGIMGAIGNVVVKVLELNAI